MYPFSEAIHSGVIIALYLSSLDSGYTLKSPMLFSCCNLVRCFSFNDLIAPTLIPVHAISKIIQRSLRSPTDRSFEISSFVYALKLLVICSGQYLANFFQFSTMSLNSRKDWMPDKYILIEFTDNSPRLAFPQDGLATFLRCII